MASLNKPFNCETKNTWLLKTVCVYWLVVKLIGWRMWTTYRALPTAPIFESLNRVPGVIHLFLLAASILLIAAVLVRNSKYVLAGLLLVELTGCLLDQNRWQPWEYQCIFTIFVFLVNSKKQNNIIPAFAFILISTYFYGGCTKLNDGFLQNVWGQLVLKSFLKLPPNITGLRWLHYCGYFLALFELLSGIGLFLKKTQKTAAWCLVIMHLFVLAMLGPFGLNYNAIIWPWNMAMIAYLYLIFIQSNKDRINYKVIFYGCNNLVFIFWGILPALHFAGYWDSFLSSAIYSGSSPHMIICINDTTKCRELQPFFQKRNSKFCSGGTAIDLQTWGLSETNVVVNPEIRVLKLMQKKLETRYATAGLSCIIITHDHKIVSR